MGNYRLDFAQWRLTWLLMIIVFPIAVVIYAFSGCDVRLRSEKRACRNGSAQQCMTVGQFYEQRADGLVATMLSNATTAKNYYDLACKHGSSTGCARFGHMIVGGSYDAMRGDDFTRNDGMTALGKACDAGETDACRELASSAEPAQAAPVLAKLCDTGDKASCDKLAAIYQDTDPKRGVELLAKRCDAGDTDHCRELAGALLAGSNSIPPDPARAVALLTKTCDGGTAGACRELAQAYLDGRLPADAARAAVLLAKACDQGDADGCFDQGKALLDGDPTHAIGVFTAECDHGDDRGCDALGDVYRVGTPAIARDSEQAHSFYDRACRHGSEFDCHKYRCLDGDADSCYRVKQDQRDRFYRLGGAFDVR